MGKKAHKVIQHIVLSHPILSASGLLILGDLSQDL
jgi:hypothetical protein